MNTPVSFKIAKLLKEKGFYINTLCYYFEDGEFRQNQISSTYGYYGEEYTVEYSELTNNWNDKFLRKKNGDSCFGCNKNKGYFETFSAPTISEVVMWIHEKYKIFITLYPYDEFREDIFSYILLKRSGNIRDKFPYNSPSEAYEAAIKYCLNNLIRTKKKK
jgi:hypothetical protein